MDTSQLIHRLHLLQRRLYEMADDLGNLTDPEIVAVSEEADRLIVQLQRLRMEEAEGRKKEESCSRSLLANPQSTEEIGQQSSALVLKHS
ncbi:MAG: hypothetical protein JWR03_1894, partial [Cohnella sp.]|jgi:stress response protein YsnF|nr:hypothetical protein [Cohnella sp.]